MIIVIELSNLYHYNLLFTIVNGNFKLLLITIILLSAMIPNSASAGEEKEYSIFEKGINYKVIDVYADGTEIVRGYKNTNDPLLTNLEINQAGHPLSSSKTALLGSADILFSQWNSISYQNFPGEIGFQSVSYDENMNFTKALSYFGIGNIQGNSEYNGPTNMAVGDVDGNLREDAIIVFYKDTNGDFTKQINIRILESWKGTEFSALGDNYQLPFGGDQRYNGMDIIPQVIASNLDGDVMKEIVVYGLDNGVPTLWIFDDAAMSVTPQQFKYGDEITISTQQLHSSYVFSTGSVLDVQISRGIIDAESEFRFMLINPNNRSSVDPILYSGPVTFKDTNNKLWSVDSNGNLKLINDGNITDSEIFTFESSNTEYSLTGGLFANSFATIRSKTGLYIDKSLGNLGTAIKSTTNTVYKIVNASAIPYNFDGTLRFLKKIANVPAPQTYPTLSNEFHQAQSMATADLDGDDKMELIITGRDTNGKAFAEIYDDRSNNFAKLKTFNWDVSAITVTPAAGDLNGDGKTEIIFYLSDDTSGSIEVYDGQTYALIDETIKQDTGLRSMSPRVAIEDMDNDGTDEFYLVTNQLKLNQFILGNSGLSNSISIDVYIDQFNENLGAFPSIGIGDVDKDSEKEIVISQSYGEASHFIGVFGYTNGNIIRETYYLGEPDSRMVNSLAIGDFNGDQFTLEYTGEFGQFNTPGELAVVAAAPPNQAGISQNYQSTGTTFGTSVSNSKSDGNEVSTGYGWYLNLQIKPTFLDIVEAGPEMSVSVKNEFTQTNTKTSTYAITEEFTGGNNDDFVLYTTTIYDTFTYKVLDAADKKMIGQNVTINIPREPTMLLQTKEFYNSRNDDADLDIGTNIFNHTPGHVPSYPSKQELFSKLDPNTKVLTTEIKTVGEGGGSIGVQIDLSTEDTTGFKKSVTTEFTAGFGLTVGGVGGSAGGVWTSSETEIHEVSVGENTAIRVDVGSIDDDQDYEDFQYSFGMAFYSKAVKHLGRIMKFYVIDYWVVVPPNWGGDSITTASEAKTVASQVDQLVVNIPFSNLLVILSAFLALNILRRKRN